MTLPTLTWRMSADYVFTPAGSQATILELFNAIRAAFDAEDVLGSNYWTISAYDTSAVGYLEFKRKGSPGGKLGTFRALLFGGTAPNAAALMTSQTANTTTIYGLTSEDANSTGPTTAFNSGLPYSNTLATAKGCKVAVLTANIANTSTNYVTIIESDEICRIIVRSNLAYFHFVFGAIGESFLSSGTRVWGYFGTGGIVQAGVIQTSVAPAAAFMPCINTAASGSICGGCAPSNVVSQLGRLGPVPITNSYNEPWADSSSIALLWPVVVGRRTDTAASVNPEPLFKLRQMRVGPHIANRKALYDGGSTLRGITAQCNSTLLDLALIHTPT